jgi:uncharacterized Zn finger protein
MTNPTVMICPRCSRDDAVLKSEGPDQARCVKCGTLWEVVDGRPGEILAYGDDDEDMGA